MPDVEVDKDEALRIALQFMQIAADWNIDEAEIDGEMMPTYDIITIVKELGGVENKG